jgi:hypothetical protein
VASITACLCNVVDEAGTNGPVNIPISPQVGEEIAVVGLNITLIESENIPDFPM